MIQRLRWSVVAAAAAVLLSLFAAPSFGTTTRTISLSISTSGTTGATITVRGTLTHTAIGSLVIIRRKSGRTWVQVTAARTKTSAGSYVHSFRLPTSRGTYYYDAYAPRTSSSAAIASTTHSVAVRTPVRATLGVSDARPTDGTPVTLTGTVSPWVPGAPVTLQHRVPPAVTWTSITLTPNAHGNFQISVEPPPDVVTDYRVVTSVHGYYTSATSPIVAVTPQHPVPPPPSDLPTTPAVTDDRTTATFMSTDANNGPTSQIAGFRYSTVSAATVAGNGGTYVAASADTASVTLPTGPGLLHLYVVAVDQYGNVSGVTDHLYANRVAGWSDPESIQLGSSAPGYPATPLPTRQLVSCMTAGKCVAVDQTGQALTFDGSTWSKPVRISQVGFAGLSCTSSTFCMAVDQNGTARTFDGATWSAPAPVTDAGRLGMLSCTSSTFCMFVSDSGWSYVFNGARWSARINAYADGLVDYSDGLSCVTPTYCLDISSGGYLFTWNGSTWSRGSGPPAPVASLGISCMTVDSCAALDAFDNIWIYDGSTWKAGPTIQNQGQTTAGLQCFASGCFTTDSGQPYIFYFNATSTSLKTVAQTSSLAKFPGPTLGLACISGYCLALHYNGLHDAVVTSSGVTQVGSIPTTDYFESLACTSDSWCRASDTVENSVGGNGQGWSRQDVPPWPTNPTETSYANGGWDNQAQLACTSASFCLSVGAVSTFDTPPTTDSMGFSTFDGTSWATPAVIPAPQGQVANVATCATPTFCMVADQQGRVATWNGSSWGPFVPVMPQLSSTYTPVITAISCVGTSFCVAVGANSTSGSPEDDVAVYRNGSWDAATAADTQAALVDVSCTSTTFCAAVDGWGAVVMFDGSKWTSPQQLATPPSTLPAANQPDTISCGSPTLCVMTTSGSGAHVWDGTQWSGPEFVNPSNYRGSPMVDVSCGTSTTCKLLDGDGSVVTYTQP